MYRENKKPSMDRPDVVPMPQKINLCQVEIKIRQILFEHFLLALQDSGHGIEPITDCARDIMERIIEVKK